MSARSQTRKTPYPPSCLAENLEAVVRATLQLHSAVVGETRPNSGIASLKSSGAADEASGCCCQGLATVGISPGYKP